MAKPTTTVISIGRNRPSMSIANVMGRRTAEHRAAIGRADKASVANQTTTHSERNLAVADQGKNHGSRQMRSDRART